MIYQEEIQVTHEYLANIPIDDEYMFRQMAIKIISKMPIDELKKFIKFKKIDPNSSEIKDKIHNYKTPNSEKQRYINLQRAEVILFQAKINTELIEAAPELYSILRDIYDITEGPFDDPVIQEDLYNRMDELIKRLSQ